MNKIYANLNRGLLFSLMPILAVACKSKEQKIADLDAQIYHVEQEYVAAENRYNAILNDSLGKNKQFAELDAYLADMMPFIDDVRFESMDILMHAEQNAIKAAARPYMLRNILTANEMKDVRQAVKSIKATPCATNAKNILAGRGTLNDLYAVSFYLDYIAYKMPFYIYGMDGAVRFNDDARNRICERFENSVRRIQARIAANPESMITNRVTRASYKTNNRILQHFDAQAARRDSMYLSISDHFADRRNHTLDSLINKKDKLILKRHDLNLRQR